VLVKNVGARENFLSFTIELRVKNKPGTTRVSIPIKELLLPGKTIFRNVELAAGLIPGNYVLIFTVDPNNRIAECSEWNNTIERNLRIVPLSRSR
jgi:hypothetical protein